MIDEQGIDWDLRIPWGYHTGSVTLRDAWATMAPHYLPEYLRRLFVWLTYKNGKVGIGSHYRTSQPVKIGAAPEGKSFHLKNWFRDGQIGAVAVDLVYEDGPDAGRDHDTIRWDVVPQQGSAEAARWGVHCNVGKPGDPWPTGESWHMQPVEIDGFDSWINAGRPAPRADYPTPRPVASLPPIPPFILEDDMKIATVRFDGYQDQFLMVPLTADSHRRISAEGQQPIVVAMPADRAQLEAEVGYTLTPM